MRTKRYKHNQTHLKTAFISGPVTKLQVLIFICRLHTPIKRHPLQRWLGMSLNGWVTELVFGLKKNLQNAAVCSQSKKLQTYKIIRHQKHDFVIFNDPDFFLQDLYVFVHVHSFEQLLYLSLALKEAEVCISYYIH